MWRCASTSISAQRLTQTAKPSTRVPSDCMTPVAIVGGGISGLTAAFYLQQRNIPVTLYESSSRVGGVIQTAPRDGFLVEGGPNTILESAPEVSLLVPDPASKSP